MRIRRTLTSPLTGAFVRFSSADSGMATENKVALLNAAAGQLGVGEIYLEVGTFRGTTIIGAASGNPDERFVTVDNFSQFSGTREQFWEAVKAPGATTSAFREGDFRRFLRTELDETVGVYFYDGPHWFLDQFDTFELIVPHLANEALVIVDDTSAKQVHAANFASCAVGVRSDCCIGSRALITGSLLVERR